MAIDLPAPIGKAAALSRPLTIELGFADEGPINATARSGSDLDLAAQLDAATGRPLRANLVLGGARADVPRADRLTLRGRVPALDVAGWLAWADTLPPPAEGDPRRPPLDVELTGTVFCSAKGAS